jgi:hypothetical protein
MAELNFYCSWNDSLQILQKLIDTKKFTFYVDKFYRKPYPISFKSLDTYILNELEERPSVNIWSDENSLFPPQFFQYEDDNLDIYLNHSGPAMNLHLARIHNFKGKTQLGNGCILIPPKFYDPLTGNSYKPSRAFLKDYEVAKRVVKECLVKRYFASRKITTQGIITPIVETIWIGGEGLKFLESGEALIRIYGEWLGINDFKERKDDVRLTIEEDEE